MDTTNMLRMVQIPCNILPTRPVRLIHVKFISTEPGTNGTAECNDIEKQLGRIPHLAMTGDGVAFNWDHRYLVRLPYEAAGKLLPDLREADYMMYLCLEPEGTHGTLPENENVTRIFDSSDRSGPNKTAPIVVYGDAFVFRLEPKAGGLDKSERAKYFDMDELSMDKLMHGKVNIDVLYELLKNAARPDRK